jgi:hypothetical protein
MGRAAVSQKTRIETLGETIQITIKVHVCKYPDRDNLMMRYCDPITGRQIARSTGTTKRSDATKAAGK